MNALLARWPALAASLPVVPLATLPTPVERLETPGRAPFWVKRDDRTASEYGGNKVRKLEFILGRARHEGAGRLITMGAAGSHHALATTLYGRRHGLEVTLVLFPQPLTPHVRDVLLADAALGAELRWVPRMEAIPLGVLAARRAHRDERCFLVAAGGSDAYGTLGYVAAALELDEQIRAGELPEPEAIHLPGGTLGTAAGLALGLALAGRATRVRAVRIASRLVTNRSTLRRLIRGAGRLLKMGGVPVPPTRQVERRVEIVQGAIGRGYGWPTRAGEDAAVLLAAAGLHLDATYTAKAAAEALSGLSSGGVQLYWHTLSGSEPVLDGGATGALPPRFRRYLDRVRPSTPDPNGA